jgi:hypothetical protein
VAFSTLPLDELACSRSIAKIDCSLPLKPPASIVVIESATDAESDDVDSEVEADDVFAELLLSSPSINSIEVFLFYIST